MEIHCETWQMKRKPDYKQLKKQKNEMNIFCKQQPQQKKNSK